MSELNAHTASYRRGWDAAPSTGVEPGYGRLPIRSEPRDLLATRPVASADGANRSTAMDIWESSAGDDSSFAGQSGVLNESPPMFRIEIWAPIAPYSSRSFAIVGRGVGIAPALVLQRSDCSPQPTLGVALNSLCAHPEQTVLFLDAYYLRGVEEPWRRAVKCLGPDPFYAGRTSLTAPVVSKNSATKSVAGARASSAARPR